MPLPHRRSIRRWLAAALLFALPAAAQDITLTYQGELTDLADAPFEGTQTLVFRLYDAESGGQEVWAERHEDVAVLAGQFAVVLGSQQPWPADLPDALWLGVQAEGDVEFEPRMQVGGALRARWAAEAAQAFDVAGRHIHPAAVSIGERPVIDAEGRWVGPTENFGGVGPRGPQGEAGPPGPAGAAGPAGDVGPRGPQGPAGAEGAVGPVGPAGAAGAEGAVGPRGPQGPAGVEGPAGPRGDVGPAGGQGPAGIAGVAGPEGPRGPAGDVGPAGPAGPVGPVGARAPPASRASPPPTSGPAPACASSCPTASGATT